MTTEKTIARYIGALFLTAMAVSIAGNGLVLPLISDKNFLVEVFAHRALVRIAGVLLLFNSMAVIGIGVLLYRVLVQHSVFVAAGYLSARVAEAVILIVGVVSLLLLPGLAEQHVEEASAAGAYLLVAGKSAINVNWYAYNMAMAILGVGSLFFCYVIYQLKLVPRLLSVLGFVGYAVLAMASVLAILDIDLGLAATLPVFLFEVVFGVWLMAKGFTPAGSSAFDSSS